MRRWIGLFAAFAVVGAIVLVTVAAIGRSRFPTDDSGRVGLAVFPFRTTGNLGSEWSEGAPDLLTIALEGTPNLRIVDPWPLWRPLRPAAASPPTPPEVQEATQLAQTAGAHRFLLGSVIPTGNQVEAVLRLYQVGRAEPMDVITVGVAADELATLVREAAVRVLARVWGPRRPTNLPSELDFDATQSPDALKAYLSAKEAMRVGQIDSANAAIDRSLALDSTFVLAIVEAVSIKSWALSSQGLTYRGLIELLARAEPYEEGLNERTRLRLEATRASVRTDGPTAIAAARQILRLDPLDYNATATLEFYERVYGWQIEPPVFGDVSLAERVVQLDSTQVTALSVRSHLAMAAGDSLDQQLQLRRLLAVDTTSSVARSTLLGLRAVLASDSEFERMMTSVDTVPIRELRGMARFLRTARVMRFERLLEVLETSRDPATRQAMVTERLRWNLARGWPERVRWDIESGIYEENSFYRTAQRYLVAADLAGMGDSELAADAVRDLMEYVPADSARAQFQVKPVWWTGWLIGAWHAQAGDTTIARTWIDAIGTLPAGGTSEDYVGSLQSDIEARLSYRRGDGESALEQAERAFHLWTIHTENTVEAFAEPTMRLHLAHLHNENDQPDAARAVLSSMVPPYAWFGFLTARASYELGILEAARGESDVARHHFERAQAMWTDGGPAAEAWAERVDSRISELGGT